MIIPTEQQISVFSSGDGRLRRLPGLGDPQGQRRRCAARPAAFTCPSSYLTLRRTTKNPFKPLTNQPAAVRSAGHPHRRHRRGPPPEAHGRCGYVHSALPPSLSPMPSTVTVCPALSLSHTHCVSASRVLLPPSSGMTLFFLAGGQGGILFTLIQGRPIFESPHTITAIAGLALLAANGVLGNVMSGALKLLLAAAAVVGRRRAAGGIKRWRRKCRGLPLRWRRFQMPATKHNSPSPTTLAAGGSAQPPSLPPALVLIRVLGSPRRSGLAARLTRISPPPASSRCRQGCAPHHARVPGDVPHGRLFGARRAGPRRGLLFLGEMRRKEEGVGTSRWLRPCCGDSWW